MANQPNPNLVATTWAQRAQAELGARHRFQVLAEKMADAGTAPAIPELALRAREDEARHARLCAAVAQHYGHATGYAEFDGVAMDVEASWERMEDGSDRLLCEVVLMCCITETINAGLLNTIFAELQPASRTGRVIRSILDDEVKHSQIGWAFLSAQSQQRDCSFVGEYLPAMLELAVKDELFWPVLDGEAELDSIPDGVLPASLRVDQFCASLEGLVLPGLEKFGVGIEPARGWLATKLA